MGTQSLSLAEINRSRRDEINRVMALLKPVILDEANRLVEEEGVTEVDAFGISLLGLALAVANMLNNGVVHREALPAICEQFGVVVESYADGIYAEHGVPGMEH